MYSLHAQSQWCVSGKMVLQCGGGKVVVRAGYSRYQGSVDR